MKNTGALCVCSLGLCFVYHWFRTKTPAEIGNETIEQESGHYFIIWADAESQSVPYFQDAEVLEEINLIRQRCCLTETLYQKDGETPSCCIYRIP